MTKTKSPGMALHQGISFHPYMMRVESREAVFWPGCAIMTLDPALLHKAHSILKRKEPSLGLASACCGQPTRFLFPDKLDRRQEKLQNLLKKAGVKRIYTSCANCELELAFLEGIEVISAWEELAKYIKKADLSPLSGPFVLHDPCPLRKNEAALDSFRKLLSLSGSEVIEPEHSRSKTLCCGNRHMLNIKQPEQSQKLRRLRLQDFPEEFTITSSCQGCLGSFAGEGRKTRHLFEVLFGESKQKGWGNRIRFTRSLGKK